MRGKSVALISLCKGEVNSIPPLALLYLATALKKFGHEAKIIHKSAEDIEEAIKEVDEYKPALVGMTVFTGYNNKNYVELSRRLKAKNYKIVWGNAHPSLLPEQALAEPSIDFVVFGEGEETLAELTDKLDSPEKYSEILGLGFKDKKGKAIINQKREFINPDDYLIDWSLIDLEYYIQPYFSGRFQRVLVITTSRGCPHNCQFCYNLVFNKRRWRAHSVESLADNLKPIIKKYNIDAIRFLDDNFFVNKKRAFRLVRELGLPYFAEARTEYVDEDFVSELKKTKCLEIMFGFESGSERIMKEVIKKGSGKKEVINTVKLLKNSGITVAGSIVFGFPSETKAEYEKTMRYIVDLLEINPNLAFTCGWYLPYPGSGLYEEAKRRGFVPPAKIGDWDKFDRWKNNYKMDWIDWDYKEAVKYSRTIVNLLALSYKRNISLFKPILRKRVQSLNFSFPVDIYILNKLRNIYFANEHNSFLKKIVNKMLVRIIKIKERKK